jgi:hypothetical protein
LEHTCATGDAALRIVKQDNLILVIWRPTIHRTYLIALPYPAATLRVVVNFQSTERPGEVQMFEKY